MFRKCSAATKSLPESALDGRVLPLHRPPFVPCAPALWASSCRALSADTWKDLVHKAMAQKEAERQSRESNCASFSFSYLLRIAKNLKSEPHIALWPLLGEPVSHRYPARILA